MNNLINTYKSSIPFLRWFYPDSKPNKLDTIFKKRSVVPELIVGLTLFLSFNSWSETSQNLGNLFIYVLWCLIALFLFTLAIENGKTLLLPDALTRPLTVAIIIFQVIVAIQTETSSILGNAITGGFLIGGISYLLFQISAGKWIGGGDVKLAFAAGLLLGWKLGLFCIATMIVLTLVSMGVEVLSSKASKTESPIRIGSGVLWVSSIFIALLIGRQLI